eukprot:3316242-Amphidinium_carterae.1
MGLRLVVDITLTGAYGDCQAPYLWRLTGTLHMMSFSGTGTAVANQLPLSATLPSGPEQAPHRSQSFSVAPEC